MEVLEVRLRGEEEAFLRLKSSIRDQDTIQLELADSARYVCDELRDEAMQTLIVLGKRLTALRRQATCRKDVQAINAIDAELGVACTQHGRTRQLRDRSVQEYHVAEELEKEAKRLQETLDTSVAYAIHVLAQEKVKRAEGSEPRPDVLSLQANLLDDISRQVSDLGQIVVRRSHALTLASRGLGATKNIAILESKVSGLESIDILPCEHEACMQEASMRRKPVAPSNAIVSVQPVLVGNWGELE